jgi:hypothetical protein
MPTLVQINQLTVTNTSDGVHVEIGFTLDAVDIGIRVKFDVVGPCFDENWECNPSKDCQPRIRITNKDITAYFDKHVTVDYTLTFDVDAPVITPIPNESHCKNVDITLNGYYHPSGVPVIRIVASAGGMIGSGSAQASTVPELTKDLSF